MQLLHDLLWSMGFVMMIISASYTTRLYHDRDNQQKFKLPLDAIIVFLIGITLYIISFYVPFPIIY